MTGKRKPFAVFAHALLLAALALALLLWLTGYAPFYAPSYLFWIGLLLALVGLVSLLKPLRFLLVSSRGLAAAVLGAGLAVAAAALFWPVPLLHGRGSGGRLDRFMAEFSFREYHETVVNAPAEAVMQAARRVSLADLPAARALVRLRALAGGATGKPDLAQRPLLELMAAPGSGFMVLDDSDPRELVLGLAGKPWSREKFPALKTPGQFLAFREPGQIRVAFNFLVRDLGSDRTLLSTETRIAGNDDRARRVFGRYWRIIYPGSAIIRRVWLQAIAAKAKRR